ncbi:MAG: hypothetical protein MJZ60_00765 [Bacteroidaceae bacterium]|nr:hypothetical protein [Bacteroidaceae bacterium]
MKKNIKITLLALLAVFGLASCDKNDYEYSPASVVAGSQVYFPLTNVTSMELGGLEGSFTVPVSRVDASEAINVKLTSSSSVNGYVVEDAVSFAEGQKEAEIKVTYKDLKYDELATLTIKLDGDVTTPYGGSEYVLKVICPAPWTPWCANLDEWVAAGNDASAWPLGATTTACTYTYTIYWTGDDPDLPISYRQSTIDSSVGQFKIEHWGADVTLYIDYNPQTHACQVAEQFAADNAKYGAVTVADIAHYSGNPDIYEKYPCTYDPTTGKFTLNLIYFVDAGSFGNKVETIQANGFYIPDYSVVAEFDGVLTDKAQNVFAQIMVDFGKDAESIKGYIAQKSDDAAAVADALASGDIEGYDIVKGINKLPLGDLTGELKVVIATIAEGEAQAVAEASFEYYGSGNASPWQSLGIGLFTDDIVGPLFGASASTYEVEIMESSEKPGLYRVMNPYSNKVYPLAEDDCAEDGLYLEIDAQDPEGVFIELQDLGFDWGPGAMAFESEGASYLAEGYSFDLIKEKGFFGTLKDGVITLPVLTNSNGIPYQGYLFVGEKVYLTGKGDFKVVLPSAVPAGVKVANKFAVKKTRSARKLCGEKYQINKIVNKNLVRVSKPVRF